MTARKKKFLLLILLTTHFPYVHIVQQKQFKKPTTQVKRNKAYSFKTSTQIKASI